jgi:type I restriction enzyme, S subunit
LARWRQRNDAERSRVRTEQSFCVPKAEIVAAAYDLHPNRYKEQVHRDVDHRPVEEIVEGLERIHEEARSGLAQLREALANLFADTLLSEPRRVALRSLCTIAGEYGAGVASGPFDATRPRYIRITDIDPRGRLNGDRVSPAGDPKDWESKRLEAGDVVFARSGATVGKTYLHRATSEDAIFAGYLIRFRPNPAVLLPEYLFAYTLTDEYRAWVASKQRAVAQPNINAKQYGGELMVPVPDLNTQARFCSAFGLIEEQIDRALSQVLGFEALFASLYANVFNSAV